MLQFSLRFLLVLVLVLLLLIQVFYKIICNQSQRMRGSGLATLTKSEKMHSDLSVITIRLAKLYV